MPQDLPGFYYDPDKNRYFPIKGPIPGLTRKPVTPSQKAVSLTTLVPSKPKKDIRISRLLHDRELYGRGSFQVECKKRLVSKPKIWKYQSVDKDADSSLAQMRIIVETPEGHCTSDALLTGGTNGSLSLFEVGNVGHYFSHGVMATSEFVGPERDETHSYNTPKDIWKINGATVIMPSSVSSISTPRKDHSNDSSPLQLALITTLGSARSGGVLSVLNLVDPVDPDSNMGVVEGLSELVSLNCTVWEAEISHCCRTAVVGTSQGATLVDLESRQLSTLCRSKSDVLSVQLSQSGNVALCGLRNGAILTVDVRQRQSQRQLAMHKLPCPSSNPNRKPAKRSAKSLFVVKGYIEPSCTVYMSSSVCCLKSFQRDDQYFLASSMDGLIKLYDHRITKRGPVQSYEGHVNSHSRIKLATDASETFFISGGQDSEVRIWSIKSGKMLFEDKFTSSVPMSVCWQGNPGIVSSSLSSVGSQYEPTHYGDAWLGSSDGLLRMQFCI